MDSADILNAIKDTSQTGDSVGELDSMSLAQQLELEVIWDVKNECLMGRIISHYPTEDWKLSVTAWDQCSL